MKITFLGTGTSQGIPIIGCDCEVCQSTDTKNKRLRTSIMLEEAGKTIVIDIGPDFRQQMLRAKVKNIDAILITHEHNDHIIGLDDVRPFNFRYGKDMPVYAVERVQKNLRKRFDYIFKAAPYPGIPKVVLNTIANNQPFEIEGIPIIPIEVMHYKLPILGFRFGNFTYLTDVKTIVPAELEKVKGTKILVLNALQRKKHISHLTLEEALALIEQIKPEKTYLLHCSHRLGLHEVVEKELPDDVTMAYDGLVLEISNKN